MPDTAIPTNGASTMHDLFLLSDEQILEIEAEPQDIEIADVYLDDADRAVLVAPAPLPAGFDSASAIQNRRQDAGATNHGLPTLSDHAAQGAESRTATSHQAPTTSHDPSAPPQWLADRMN